MNRISLSSPYCVLFWSNQTPEKLFLLHRLTVLSIYVNKREDNVTVCNVGCVTTLRNKFPKGHSSYLSLMFIYESDICWCGTSGQRKDRDKRVVTKKSHDFTQMVILKKIKIKNEQANGDKWFFRSKGQWIINIHLFYLIRVLCWQVDKKKCFPLRSQSSGQTTKHFLFFLKTVRYLRASSITTGDNGRPYHAPKIFAGKCTRHISRMKGIIWSLSICLSKTNDDAFKWRNGVIVCL